MALKGHRKFWGELTPGFQFSLEKFDNFVQAAKKVKTSNFFSWFWLNDKLLAQKLDTTVSSPDSQGLCKVSAKSDSFFPIQPTKKCYNFFKQARRSKFQISLVGFG